MTSLTKGMIVAALWLFGVAVVGADSLPAPLKHAKVAQLGEVLVGPTGMTLYTFANDKEPGKSVCNGPCAENWPPFKPEATAPAPKAPLSVITRDDGSKQYAFKGKPLYYWKNDKKAGDATGHGVNNVWAVAKN
jgi:predicted lipoprotein with Yx(FWY)xxD motif